MPHNTAVNTAINTVSTQLSTQCQHSCQHSVNTACQHSCHGASCHGAGRAPLALTQAYHPAPGPEVPQHAGGAPLEGQGHRLQPEPHGADLLCRLLHHILAGQQPQMACT